MINELKFVDNGDDTCTFSIILDDQVTQQVVFDMPFEQLFMSMISLASDETLADAAEKVGIHDDMTFVVPDDIESM